MEPSLSSSLLDDYADITHVQGVPGAGCRLSGTLISILSRLDLFPTTSRSYFPPPGFLAAHREIFWQMTWYATLLIICSSPAHAAHLQNKFNGIQMMFPNRAASPISVDGNRRSWMLSCNATWREIICYFENLRGFVLLLGRLIPSQLFFPFSVKTEIADDGKNDENRNLNTLQSAIYFLVHYCRLKIEPTLNQGSLKVWP